MKYYLTKWDEYDEVLPDLMGRVLYMKEIHNSF